MSVADDVARWIQAAENRQDADGVPGRRVQFTEHFLTRERHVRVEEGTFWVIAPADAHECPGEHEFLLRQLDLSDLPETRWSLFHGQFGMTCVIQTADGYTWSTVFDPDLVADEGAWKVVEQEYVRRQFVLDYQQALGERQQGTDLGDPAEPEGDDDECE